MPLLVDPQAHYLQDVQHRDYPWTRLPFARAEGTDPGALTGPAVSSLVESCLQFQMEQGATALIAPGVHVETPGDGWLAVQLRLLRVSREVLDRTGVALPLLAPVQLSWRLLDRHRWIEALTPLLQVVLEVGAAEVLLAAGKVDHGVRPYERLADLSAAIGHLSGQVPVLAWHQGQLGETCVAAGARGYECGIGRQEHCDLRGEAAAHRHLPVTPPRLGRRAVYAHPLRRSIPARSVHRLTEVSRDIRDRLACPSVDCCPDGVRTLDGDARRHAVLTRARSLQELVRSDSPRWQWSVLAHDSDRGLELARRINRIASQDPLVTNIRVEALGRALVVALMCGMVGACLVIVR